VIGLVIAALIAVVALGAYGIVAIDRKHDARLNAACADADALRGARLLDEAADAYGAIARADPGWRCRASDVAIGPGLACDDEYGPLTVCDETPHAADRQRATTGNAKALRWPPREMTASEWQADVQAARRVSRERLEQASQYDRQFASASGRKRALDGYRVGLYLDPSASDARREAQALLTRSRSTTLRTDANVRCKLAGRLFAAGLVPEARMVYAQALQSGQTTVCKRNGLERERWTSAWALDELKHAAAEHHGGNDEGARLAYIHALAADSSLTGARSELAALPGPDPAGARNFPSTMAHLASGSWNFVEDATAFVQKRPETLAAVAAILGLLFLIACLVLQWFARIRRLRPRMDRHRVLQRFTRTQVRVQPFTTEGGDNGNAEATHIAEMTTGFFQHAVRQHPLTSESDADTESGNLDVITAVTETPQAALTGQVLPPLKSLEGVAAVLTWMLNLIPREEIAVAGQLLEPGDRGRGLRLHVYARRGRAIAWRDFWHDDIRSMSGEDAKHEYLELVRYAAAWVIANALRPRARGDWRPNGWFQAGVACQQSGRYPEAVELYTKVLDDDRFAQNTALLHNLAVCRIRVGDHDGALEALDALDNNIGQVWGSKPEVKPPYSAGYNRALALQYVAMADRKHAAAKYGEALDVSKAVLRALLASPHEAPIVAPALMLHAGLLLSTADPLEPGRPREGEPPPAVREASVAIAWNACPHEERPVREALADVARAADIAYWVREQYGSDPRALYNLACFEARLAARYRPLKDKVLKRAKADLKAAQNDSRLKAWAEHDPALRVRTLEHDEEWQELLGVEQPVAAA
jgi:tetratricopeptide (TPR) repeat protein